MGKTGLRKSKVGSLLTDAQIKFCELYANGMHMIDAYRKAYNNEAGSRQQIDNSCRRLLRQTKIIDEIERIQEFNTTTTQIMGTDAQDFRVMEREGLLNPNGVNTLNKEQNLEWTQNLVFEKMKTLLDGCEGALTLMKERPKLFSEVKVLISKVKRAIDLSQPEEEKWQRELIECMENIEDIIYKVGKFKATEFNSTVNTANSLMKEMNNITGITKNVKELENQSFESKLLGLISTYSGPGANNLKEELTEYAFEGDTE